MPSYSDNVLWQFVKTLRIPVSKKILNDYLYTHPHFPSVLSITDTLTELGIDNLALEIPKENLYEIPIPFLAHLKTGKGGEFLLVKDPSAFAGDKGDFHKRWSGVVIAAEPIARLSHNENNRLLKKEQRQKQITIATAVALLSISAFTFVAGWLPGAITALSLAGILVATMIVMKDLGVHNDLADSICSTGEHTDCNTVLRSSAGKLLSFIGLSDIGLIYFVSQWGILLLSVISGTTASIMQLYKILAVASLPFMIFSVYYQWQVAKKWCTMCLAVVSLLFLQMGLLVSFIPGWTTGITISSVLHSIVLMAAFAGVWLATKSMLKKNEAIQQELYETLRFKNNVETFRELLYKQRVIENDPLSYELELANGDAPLQIMVASNPYCGPCAITHEILHGLAEKYPEKISIIIRFSIDAGNIFNPATQAAHNILQRLYGSQDPVLTRRLLHDWYSTMDIDAFKEKYYMQQPPDVSSLIQEHYNWDTGSAITATPTIFINGHLLPKEYLVKDLSALVRNLITRPDILTPKELLQLS